MAGSKKGRKKPTGKEVAVVVVSVIMVVSILLPSFSQIFASQPTTSSAPTSFDGAASKYRPEVDSAKEAVDRDGGDKAAQLKLAQACYQWGIYAESYAGNDDEQSEAKELLDQARQAFGAYLNLEGSLESDEARNAAVDRALCDYYAGDTAACIESLKPVADETNYAPAWANLGMMYQNQGSTQDAMDAYQHGIDADPDGAAGVKSYCEQMLSSLKGSAASESGGAEALSQKLDTTQPSS